MKGRRVSSLPDESPATPTLSALREQTAEAVGSLRDLENARLDALQYALWDAAMTGNRCLSFLF
jgi:hypothetical protein